MALGGFEYEAAGPCSPGGTQPTKGAVLADLWNGSARQGLPATTGVVMR